MQACIVRPLSAQAGAGSTPEPSLQDIMQLLQGVSQQQILVSQQQALFSQQQASVALRLESVGRRQDAMWEGQARGDVRLMFGERFARQFTAQSLQDLSAVASTPALASPYSDDNQLQPSEQHARALRLAKQLLNDRMDARLLQDLMQACDRFGYVQPGSEVSSYVGAACANDLPVGSLMGRLLALQRTDSSRKAEHLITCSSSGIALAVYASQQSKYTGSGCSARVCRGNPPHSCRV